MLGKHTNAEYRNPILERRRFSIIYVSKYCASNFNICSYKSLPKTHAEIYMSSDKFRQELNTHAAIYNVSNSFVTKIEYYVVVHVYGVRLCL
jgi:hypothetical protein